LISTIPKDEGTEIGRKFEEFEKQLKTKTQNPEEVQAMKDYMLTLPMKINDLRGEVDQTEVYNIHLYHQAVFVSFLALNYELQSWVHV
jgi:dynein heavy chain